MWKPAFSGVRPEFVLKVRSYQSLTKCDMKLNDALPRLEIGPRPTRSAPTASS